IRDLIVTGVQTCALPIYAPWTSYGYTAEGFAKPELGAPGRWMIAPVPTTSTLATTFADRIVAPGYMWMSGTSFSAPVVSGIAAQDRKSTRLNSSHDQISY